MINDGGNGYTFWQFCLADPVKALAPSGNEGRGGPGTRGSKGTIATSQLQEYVVKLRGQS
jgi:hypothetical protein